MTIDKKPRESICAGSEIQSFEHRESKCKTTFYNAVAKDKKPNGSERASVQGRR